MFAEPVTLDLLLYEIVKPCPYLVVQDDIIKRKPRVAKLYQSFEIAARSGKRDGYRGATGGLAAGLIDGGAKFLGRGSASLPGFGGSDLERDGIELLVIALRAAAYHR